MIPYINDMARWRTCQLGRQISAYEKLSNDRQALAGIIYKDQWLTSDAAFYVPDEKILLENDLDGRDLEKAEQELLGFLEEQAINGGVLYEGEENFQKFADKFLSLYKIAFPDDQSVRRGTDRTWKHTGIQNHLKKAFEQTSGQISFLLERDLKGSKNGWYLCKGKS